MIGVVVCTHAKLADALIDAAEMILGDFPSASTVSVLPGESGEDIVDKLSTAISRGRKRLRRGDSLRYVWRYAVQCESHLAERCRGGRHGG